MAKYSHMWLLYWSRQYRFVSSDDKSETYSLICTHFGRRENQSQNGGEDGGRRRVYFHGRFSIYLISSSSMFNLVSTYFEIGRRTTNVESYNMLLTLGFQAKKNHIYMLTSLVVSDDLTGFFDSYHKLKSVISSNLIISNL